MHFTDGVDIQYYPIYSLRTGQKQNKICSIQLITSFFPNILFFFTFSGPGDDHLLDTSHEQW